MHYIYWTDLSITDQSHISQQRFLLTHPMYISNSINIYSFKFLFFSAYTQYRPWVLFCCQRTNEIAGSSHTKKV